VTKPYGKSRLDNLGTGRKSLCCSNLPPRNRGVTSAWTTSAQRLIPHIIPENIDPNMYQHGHRPLIGRGILANQVRLQLFILAYNG